MKFFIFLIALWVTLVAADGKSESAEWKHFKSLHQRKFENPVDEHRRQKVFLKNLEDIKEHNKLYSEGKVSYRKALNKFADLPNWEFVKRMNGFRSSLAGPNNVTKESMKLRVELSTPEEVDWRLAGAVGPVQDQSTCGSCWTFASVAAIEGQEFLRNGRLVELSEQNLLDCAKSAGCLGGHMISAFDYVRDNLGISYRYYYPYEKAKLSCRYRSEYAGARISGYERLPSGSEESLKLAVATIGPIAVGIHGDLPSLQQYGGGIYFDPQCSSYALSHAVTVVGYGSENGFDYWLIKNSWGSTWGENGYFKLARNMGNHCGVATDASYPVMYIKFIRRNFDKTNKI